MVPSYDLVDRFTVLWFYSLPTLLLQSVLNLQVGKSSNNEEQRGVDLAEISVIAPGHSDHLPAQTSSYQKFDPDLRAALVVKLSQGPRY